MVALHETMLSVLLPKFMYSTFLSMKTPLRAAVWLRVFSPEYSDDVRSTDFCRKGGVHSEKSALQIRELDGHTQGPILLWDTLYSVLGEQNRHRILKLGK